MKCETCRFWSQMLAQSLDGGPIEAWCLSQRGPYKGGWTRATAHCDEWRENIFGAMDEPGWDYEQLAKAYEDEDARRNNAI